MTVKELIDKLSSIPEIADYEVTVNEIVLRPEFIGYNLIKKEVTIREHVSYNIHAESIFHLRNDIEKAIDKYLQRNFENERKIRGIKE